MKTTTREAIAPLLLRIIIGTGFMAHGWAKMSRGSGGFEKLLTLEGVPMAHANSFIGPYVELFGGLMILAGAYVMITAVPLIFTMLVAMVFVQGHYCFSSVQTIGLTPEGPRFGPPGYEINLLYIAGLISLMLTGAGLFSIDALRRKGKGYA